VLPYRYILGMSHSGSTLLAFLLNAHPEVVSVGETSRITELLPQRWLSKKDACSCGQAFYACPFWNRTLAGLAARGHGLSEPDFFDFKPREKKQADAKLKALVESMLYVSGKRVLLDASKHTQYLPPILDNPYLDVKVVDLYRDGRGIVNSWRKNRPQGTAEKLTREWKRRERIRRETLAGVAPDRILRVQYEAFARSPRETLAEIFAFIGVDPAVDVVDGYKTQVEHHIIGNQMRLDTREAIVFDEKWRRELPADWQETFERVGGQAVNRQNGYDES
jgi:hypothetical protein